MQTAACRGPELPASSAGGPEVLLIHPLPVVAQGLALDHLVDGRLIGFALGHGDYLSVSTSTETAGSGSTAGPSSTAPSASKREP